MGSSDWEELPDGATAYGIEHNVRGDTLSRMIGEAKHSRKSKENKKNNPQKPSDAWEAALKKAKTNS